MPASAPTEKPDPNATVIPAGTKLPLLLKQAISTKNAREGDAVYAETAFPFVVNDRIVVPSGTYIQEDYAYGAPGAVEEAGGDFDPLYDDDLSERVYGDAAGVGGEHAGGG